LRCVHLDDLGHQGVYTFCMYTSMTNTAMTPVIKVFYASMTQVIEVYDLGH
jgi:hypothetical protein